MSSLFTNLFSNEATEVLEASLQFFRIAQSAAGGVILGLTTYLTHRKLDRALPSADPEGPRETERLISGFNSFFLSVAMTATMIAISNSLARAFALGAAMGLVRFRIKLDRKTVGMHMLCAVIYGVACGVGQPLVGATLLSLFIVAQTFLIFVISAQARRRS